MAHLLPGADATTIQDVGPQCSSSRPMLASPGGVPCPSWFTSLELRCSVSGGVQVTNRGQYTIKVMNPMAKARGLQLPWNDKGAASGCMTSARQDRSPAACAPSGAWVRNRGLNPSVDAKHFTRATFPASNPQCSVFTVLSNRSLCSKAKCLSTPTVYHSREET